MNAMDSDVKSMMAAIGQRARKAAAAYSRLRRPTPRTWR